MKKGMTIYQFLQKALEVLRTDFPELKTVTADQLMYVKEDLIIPQTNTFYDFIVTKVSEKKDQSKAFGLSELTIQLFDPQSIFIIFLSDT